MADVDLSAVVTAANPLPAGAAVLTDLILVIHGGQIYRTTLLGSTFLTTIGGAPLASPVFTGTPAAPTAGNGTNTTQLATTAFVQNTLGTLPTIVSKTTNYTVLVGDKGTHFNNAGATGTVIFTLPAWALGLRYTFVVVANQTITVTANGGDLLKSDVFSAGTISGSSQYSVITVECHASGIWVIMSATGSWS